MKSDLNHLMEINNLDALWITGNGQHNPAMVYLTGGGHFNNADLFIRRNADPVLFCNPMEREEAAKSGFTVRNIGEYRPAELLKQAGGDLLQATIARYKLMFADLGLEQAQIGVYGQLDAGYAHAVMSGIHEALPGLVFTSDLQGKVLLAAMATKDTTEVERIRRMGQITTQVVGETADFLSRHSVHDEVLIKKDGTPLTIGEVKGRINLLLAERGAENPEGTIFAIGRDAGIPHSTGAPGDLLRLGQTIVFDIFPCEAGGGYYYDFTRTWCLGYAPDPAQALYENVLSVYQQIMKELRLGAACSEYQLRTCEMFEAQGHVTIRTDPQTQSGYVHSVGHGLGLHIHERPFMRLNGAEDDLLVPGVIVTVEPGLYYPERGLGVRLEDTVWVRPDGKMEIPAPYPLDLVIPVGK
ncbi:MAG TPA: M24 family metallopeptidase [Anaerolineales bacterium]|nr:M24 family metallopeptidase [Anaerolineales bacterium]